MRGMPRATDVPWVQPGLAAGPDENSQAAYYWLAATKALARLRRQVFLTILSRAEVGATPHEIAMEAGLDIVTVRARCTELQQSGWLRRKGKRLTPSGRQSHVYMAEKAPPGGWIRTEESDA